MTPDDSPETSTDAHSRQSEWSVEEWWAEKTKPSRQRNLTPSQRRSRAEALKLLRRARWDKTLVVRS